MDLGLQGKVALVTGASAGIGRGTAKALAREGATAVVVARRKALLESLGREIEEAGATAPIIICTDLTQPDAPTGLTGRVLDAFGRVDILVNNAGGSRPLTTSSTEEEWDEANTLNLTSPRRLGHAVLPAREACIRANVPAGYLGEPEDVASVVTFLASDRARYVTGQRPYVDGGMHRAL